MRRRRQRDSKLVRQLSELQNRLIEAEDTLSAIRNGTVDALVVHTPRGEQLFTLKGADQTYRVLVEGMNEGAVTVRRGIISYCNNRFAELSRTPMERVFGASIFDFVAAPGLVPLVKRLTRGAGSSGVLEGELRASDGKVIPVRISASRFHSEGVPMISMVLTDMTAQMEAQRASQELSRKIINAQEQERQRVARDLHDGVNQLLSTAKFRLEGLSSLPPARTDPKVLELVRNVIERALNEVRSISRNLRPSELDDLGLTAALRSLIREFQERSGIRARFNNDLEESTVPQEVELTIYRIAQEALNNVEKHSKARGVSITLSCPRNNKVVLVVRDDGKGFVRERHNGGGWGLQNMTERASLLNGSVQIESAAGKGTRLSVRIPIESKLQGAASRRNENRS